MTWCTTCGTEGFGQACPRCGAPYPAPPQPQPTPVDAADTLVAPPNPWGTQAPDPYRQQGYQPQGYPPAQQPWPAVPPPMLPTAAAPRRTNPLPFVAAGVALLVVGAGAALAVPRLLGSGPAAAAAPAPASVSSTARTPLAPVTPTLAAPATSVAAAPAAPVPPAAAPVTVTRTVAVPAAADVLSGTYVMVLESLDKNTVSLTQARAKAAALASGSGRVPKVLDSSATAGMNPGYWAVVDGPHASESAARASCAAYGRTQGTGECYLRVLG